MHLITNTNEITSGVCFLLMYPSIYDNDAKNAERLVIWLKENFSFEKQDLLLIALYCNASQIQVIIFLDSKLET